jgi:hypothetical protein
MNPQMVMLDVDAPDVSTVGPPVLPRVPPADGER